MLQSHVVLIVDDDPANREMLADGLADAGIEVAVASGVEEALGLLGVRRFSIVVTDVYMFPLTGFDLLDRLAGRLPVVLMSAFASDEVRAQGAARGAKAVLTKPFRPDELLGLLVGD